MFRLLYKVSIRALKLSLSGKNTPGKQYYKQLLQAMQDLKSRLQKV